MDRRKNKLTNYRSPPIRRRDEPMKKQNRENEEKDSDTHRQETEKVAGREKVGDGAIKRRRTQKEIATKPKIAEDTDAKEKEDNQEPILKDKQFPPITKIDKEEKK